MDKKWYKETRRSLKHLNEMASLMTRSTKEKLEFWDYVKAYADAEKADIKKETIVKFIPTEEPSHPKADECRVRQASREALWKWITILTSRGI